MAQKLILTDAWQQVSDGSKQVLISARSGEILWTDGDTPAAGAEYQILSAGDQILLPAGMKVSVKQINQYSNGYAVYTTYP